MSTDQVTGASCSPNPVYADEGNGDFHLLVSDACAIDVASDPSGDFTLCTGCVDVDYDGDSRPRGSDWEAGADEYAESGMFRGATATGVTLP